MLRAALGSHIILVYPGDEECSCGPAQLPRPGPSLLAWVFGAICEISGHPHVDLFAT